MKRSDDYPRMLFHRTKDPVTVQSREEETALGKEWARTVWPPEPEPKPEPEEDEPEEPEPEEPEPEEPEEEEEVSPAEPYRRPAKPPVKRPAAKVKKKR